MKSADLLKRAQFLMPGGVNSPVRSFSAVGLTPPFIAYGGGSRIFDADGREYVDYVCSWGPLILGHAHPTAVEAVERAARDGLSFGAPTEREVEMAELITSALPSMEMIRMVNSGTEAVLSALRLARGCTGRPYIVKFSGCYHGHSDSMLVEAGSGLATAGTPNSAGILPAIASATLVARYNDPDSVRELFAAKGAEIAAVIVEPIAANMGLVPPEPDFLPFLRRVADEYGALLIFDEVISGFRVAYGGAQTLYGVRPDLTVLGKIIGGGLPVGAYGGRRELMRQVAPLGPVYQAGTLAGNPVAMAAGLATLKILQGDPAVYARLEEKGRILAGALRQAAADNGRRVTVHQIGSLLTLFFTPGPVAGYADARQSDTALFARFFESLLARGVYIAPSQFEALFISAAHTDADLRLTIAAAEAAMRELDAPRSGTAD
ncbi:MAG: glutamate-1-semialdehyde 2,1-aminomutase [Gracilibacteraceae bacterium]|jgi:glutamate-1-semialdehyde 2,1-aminomutase|nr:glutamate-1-semialdehyde 2,1-aminomutase [Gracilibacteraceae bacterium]